MMIPSKFNVYGSCDPGGKPFTILFDNLINYDS